MKNQDEIRVSFVLSVAAVGLFVIAVAIVVSKSMKHEAAPIAVTAPDVSGPAAQPKGLARTPAPTEENATRPETELLQGLPKVQVTRAANSPLSDLKVSFKLDSRLTKSLYMGDRWLAPATYLQIGAGEECTVEASIRGLNAQGKAVNTPATWQVADSGMVTVSPPGPGNTVKLTVTHPGQTTVEIASQGITKRLPLHATSYGGTLMVALAQE